MTAATYTIALIRHAEEPGEGRKGVNQIGREDAASLSIRGWERAGALVQFFDHPTAPILRPQSLFAAASRPDSRRPAETLVPLARRLDLPIRQQWCEDALRPLVDTLLDEARPALVCWRHRQIPAFAELLLGRPVHPGAWDAHRYDLVWLFQRDARGWRMREVPQNLLAGDCAEAADLTASV